MCPVQKGRRYRVASMPLTDDVDSEAITEAAEVAGGSIRTKRGSMARVTWKSVKKVVNREDRAVVATAEATDPVRITRRERRLPSRAKETVRR